MTVRILTEQEMVAEADAHDRARTRASQQHVTTA